MNYVVKKEGKGSYKVKDKYTGSTKGTRPSHAEAQRLAVKLHRLRLAGFVDPTAAAEA